jgi:SAM-dependent methyltransferase
MDPKAYLEMAEIEDQHWWFVGRRAVLRVLVRGFGLSPEARVLEVGSGTGGNLQMLTEFGKVKAIEMDPTAREISIRKTNGHVEVRHGHCPEDIGFPDDHFNLICMFDVLEHVDEDVQTLSALRPLLTSDGRLLVTVPAFSWLWSNHDDFLHHKRRYSAKHLERTAAAAGLKLERLSYFNTLLFPIGVLARWHDRMLGRSVSTGSQMPGAFANFMLRKIFSAESVMLKNFNLPFGMSLLAVLRAD